MELAVEQGLGFVLESPTWRANPRWATELGYSAEQLDALNRGAIALMEELRDAAGASTAFVISGCIGPHDDGYSPATTLGAEEARDCHSTQIATFADTAADMVSAITMTATSARSAEPGAPARASYSTSNAAKLDARA